MFLSRFILCRKSIPVLKVQYNQCQPKTFVKNLSDRLSQKGHSLNHRLQDAGLHSVNFCTLTNNSKASFNSPNFFENNYCRSRKIRQFATMSDSDGKKAELRKKLTPIQFHVTQEKGTERPFTGAYNKFSEAGTYSCVVCDQPLFSSNTKFDSGCGWPAFNNVLDQGRVKLTKDTSHGMVRTEVTCAGCGAHLGHVFGDGPPPTRKRFCINSASLQFHPADGNEHPDLPKL